MAYDSNLFDDYKDFEDESIPTTDIGVDRDFRELKALTEELRSEDMAFVNEEIFRDGILSPSDLY